jgi:hypothetical protein
VQERLLHGVLRFVERGEHPVAVDGQFAPVALGERREDGLLTGDRGGDLVGSIHRHLSTRPHVTFAIIPVMPAAPFA